VTSRRTRFYKKLTDEQIVSSLVAGENAAADSAGQLPLAGGCDNNGWLADGIAKGFYKVREVALDGIPTYRYFFHVTDQKFLHINASVVIGSAKQNPALWDRGAELIARELGCRGIEFETLRPGLVTQALGHGYAISGVLLTKKI
jgi:hypothetical protein